MNCDLRLQDEDQRYQTDRQIHKQQEKWCFFFCSSFSYKTNKWPKKHKKREKKETEKKWSPNRCWFTTCMLALWHYTLRSHMPIFCCFFFVFFRLIFQQVNKRTAETNYLTFNKYKIIWIAYCDFVCMYNVYFFLLFPAAFFFIY